MTPVILPKYEYVLMFIIIILVIQVLKRRGIIDDSHEPVFDRLVIELALPGIVFASLASTPAHPEWIVPAVLLAGAVLICLLVTSGICRVFRLPSAITGTVVLMVPIMRTAIIIFCRDVHRVPERIPRFFMCTSRAAPAKVRGYHGQRIFYF